ncbi:MAG: HDIG domain-containing protein [Anaerolineales bacterium]|jgi:putative nucleotidyltransferase with HDIG domain
MEDTSARNLSPTERLRQAWLSARLWFILLLGIVGTVAAISIPISNQNQSYGLQVNDVASQDILAPYALSYVSDILTERARNTAAENVAQVYDTPDNQVTREQLDRLQAALNFIDSVRADTFATRSQKLDDLSRLTDLRLTPEQSANLLDLTDSNWQNVKSESLAVLEQVMRSEIRPGRLEEARRTVPALVSISLPETQARLVEVLASPFVAPNSLPNQDATEQNREAARAAVEPVTKSYSPGETIVNRGEIVTGLELEALQQYGLLKPPNPWKTIALNSLLVVMLAGVFILYGIRLHPEQLQRPNLALTVSLLFILIGLVMQLMIPGRTVLPYVFPAATLPILLSVFFSPGMGIMTSLVIGALAGYLAPRGLELALYAILSGVLASLMIGRAERLGAFMWAGIAASVGAALVIILFRIPDQGTDVIGKASLLGASIASGLLSTSLGFGLLLILGNLLGITTNLQLIELSRPDHPLLQQILTNSPGTYQHSLQVANLAEQAARAIGANPLLTRVGALYHDVGKSARPQFFIENQVTGQNIHEQLDPRTSADIILAHVREGLELARKYRIPQSIRDFITEHHGTLDAAYQYHEAVKAAGGDDTNIDKRDFTYPGPRPRSRETALLMLADGVEAAARGETPQNEEEIDKLVRWVIEDRRSKGQLDRTELTLKDLDTIRRSFVNTLKNIYHPRIRYPQNNENGSPVGTQDPEATKPSATAKNKPDEVQD